MTHYNTGTCEKINIKQVVSEDSRQEVVRSKVTIPMEKPDIEDIISVYKSVSVNSTTITDSKVLIEGTISLQIVYVAAEVDQPVHHTHGEIDFTSYVELPGVEDGMNVHVEVEIEDVQARRENSRTISVNVVLEVHAKATETREVEVLTKLPGCKVDSEEIKVNHVIGSESIQTIVDDVFNIPEEKPNAEKILDVVDTKVVITDTRILKDKVIIDGEVILQILYVSAEDPSQPVHHVHTEYTFSEFVEIPGATSDKNVEVEAVVESSDVEFAGDEENGYDRLRAYVVLQLNVDVTESRVINIITKVYDCHYDTEVLHVESVIGEDSRQVILRDTFTPPGEKPPAEKILDATAGDVEITEKRVLNNKVVVRGNVNVHVIYVACSQAGDQPVHSVHRELSFRAFLDIPGTESDMDVQVRVMVEYIKASLSNSDIHIEAILKVTGKVVDTMRKEVVLCVRVLPEEPEVCPPGETIKYTIKAGDTFFKLAQRYGTTVEAIQKANPHVNPNNLQIGQVIKIPCGPVKPKG